MKVMRKISSAMITGVIRAGVSPLTSDGLNEAFSLAIGLRAIGSGEEMTQPELLAGGSKELGAVS